MQLELWNEAAELYDVSEPVHVVRCYLATNAHPVTVVDKGWEQNRVHTSSDMNGGRCRGFTMTAGGTERKHRGTDKLHIRMVGNTHPKNCCDNLIWKPNCGQQQLHLASSDDSTEDADLKRASYSCSVW